MTRHAVLIVEDNEQLRQLYRTALTLAGYDVSEADDGLDALIHMDRSIPDLIVLMLPTIDGLAVLQEISAQALMRRMPVVVIGSSDALNHIDVACLLHKPVSAYDLVKVVRTCLASAHPEPA